MAPSTALVASAASETDVVAPINGEQSLKASRALLAYIKKSAAEPVVPAKRSLIEDDDADSALAEMPIWLNIVTKRHIVTKPHLRPSKVYLPHPMNTKETTTICLITADPQRAYKDLVADEKFPADLRKRISRVIGFKKLKAKFTQYEAQRALYADHDIFLADDRIVNRLPAVLGKTFFKNTSKRPVPVVLAANPNKKSSKNDQPAKKKKKTEEEQAESIGSPERVAKEIERALGAALVSLNPSPQICVKAGTADMRPEDLAENLDVLARAVVDKHVPHKWKNVKGIFVKGPQTTALPIWQTDMLWLEDKDVVSDRRPEENGSEPAGLIEGTRANGSKKRKAGNDVPEFEGSPLPKKSKKGTSEQGAAPKGAGVEEATAAKAKKDKKAKVAVPDSNDSQLDKQIAERKTKLKQQKQAARKAVEA